MIQCPKCGFENAKLASYCTTCGAQLKLRCPECGAIIENGAVFCPQCGMRLSVQTHPDLSISQKVDHLSNHLAESLLPQLDPYERRVVTILFADIAGYSTLAERIDPEKLAEIMSDAYPCLLEPIREFDGSIIQVMGDGLLAYFGTPSAREDDPERAVLAGLAIVSNIQKYAKKLKIGQVLEDFHVRVGVNTGLVVVGEMNPDKTLEYIALGDAVNLAARLQQNAPKDGVLISQATYQHVHDLFDFQLQEPLIVKGRKQSEKTYLVVGRKPDYLRIQKRGLEGVETTMIGREPEIAALKNLYQDAIEGGETALVLISGEPGIGKTRLVNEFVGWLSSQTNSPKILRGRSIQSTQEVPYGVLRNLFARNFGILESDTSLMALEKFRRGTINTIENAQADLIGQLIGFDFSASPSISHLLGDASYSEIAEIYLKNYLRRLAEKPLLILLEDIHWMDNRTLDFIIELVNELSKWRETQLMIVCTVRPQFFEKRPKWGEGVEGFTRLNLRKLSHLQSRSLINEILFRVENIPGELHKCIVDEAGGNPFFIEEMIKMFIDEGVIETKPEPWVIRLDKLATLHVPSTLKGILQARLDSLPPAEKLVVQHAAVIGKTFWDGILRILTTDELESQKIYSRLDSLRERGLIYHRERSSIAGNQEYQFKHALFCDEAYETVLIRHRRKYHKQVAKWIEDNAGDRISEHLGLIAFHYLESDEKNLAVDWFIKAGERAINQCSMVEAKVLFEKALNLIKKEDFSRLWRATLGHDEAVGMLGERDARITDDNTLLNLAKKLHDDKLLAEAYYRIGSQSISEGNNRAALHAFNLSLEAANRAGYVMMQALVLPMKVSILTSEGDLRAAGTLTEEALEIAEKTRDADVLARALTNIAPYYQAVGDISKSVALMQQVIDINKKQDNRLGETIGLINLGYFSLSLGKYEIGQNLLEKALKIARKLGALGCEAYSLLNLGLAEWRMGQPKAACETLGLSLGKLEALGDERGLASRQFYLGLAYESAGDWIKAKREYVSACDSSKMIGTTSGIVEALAGLARLALKSGDASGAEHFALQIISYLDQESSQGLEFPILAILSCVKVFDALKDTSMFQHALKIGLKEIENQLAKITETEWRETFIKEVPENRELLAYANQRDKKFRTKTNLNQKT